MVYNENVFDLFKKIESNSVDFVLTDIPYLISKKQNFKNIMEHQAKDGKSDYCCMDFGEWDKEFDVDTYIKECYRILKPSRSIIVWSAWQQLNNIENIYKTFIKGKDYGGRRIGIWEKANPSVFNMQRMALQPYEFFIWNRKGSNWIFNNQNEKYTDKKGVERQKAERHYFKHGCIHGGHVNAKPISIFEYLIKTYTNEGDIVFDGVVGGGTTAIACKNTNRKFIVNDMDKKWYDKTLKLTS